MSTNEKHTGPCLRDQYRDAVMSDTSLFPAVRVVAWTMSRCMDFHTLANARPGLAQLIEWTGCDRKTVRDALKKLVEKGWLVQDRRGGLSGGANHASMYHGMMATPNAEAQAKNAVRVERNRTHDNARAEARGIVVPTGASDELRAMCAMKPSEMHAYLEALTKVDARKSTALLWAWQDLHEKMETETA